MQLNTKPEVLAPAGTLEAVTEIIGAGADAVYLGGKNFNMRQHRSSYNLNDSDVAAAIKVAHDNNKKLYYTLNSLMRDSQLPELRKTLSILGELKPDAIIVQDLGVASLAREICVHIPLHASTMMNVHNTESALALKMMGFTRIITSRDIPLHEIRRMGEGSGLEMECFVHGDMCVSQSSQCYISGILFGESSNCGRCMKPCRWEWELVTQRGQAELPGETKGYLLARKDLCLFQHIPALIHNGIVSLKIEGRMRTAEFTVPIVEAYRKAVDSYFDDPVNYSTNAAQMDDLFSRRVREYTTSHTFSNSSANGIDTSGSREPRFFSHASPEPVLTVDDDCNIQPSASDVELIVHVSGQASADPALKSGANAIYLCGESFIHHNGKIKIEWLSEFVKNASNNNVRVAIMLPHITDEQEMAQWKQWLRKASSIKQLEVGVSNLGSLKLVRDLRIRNIIADFPLNITNSIAADELSTMGAGRATASVELDFEQLSEFVKKSHLPIEVIAHGPLLAMTLEHCVIAAASNSSPKDICPMDCRRGVFALKDTVNQEFAIEPDKRCRNHIFTANDVCVLPNLSKMMSLGVSGLRIEAQLDSPSAVKKITDIYRKGIDSIIKGEKIDFKTDIEQIKEAAGRNLTDGPYDFQRTASLV